MKLLSCPVINDIEQPITKTKHKMFEITPENALKMVIGTDISPIVYY